MKILKNQKLVTVPRDSYTFNFYSDELIGFSKNKKDLELFLAAKKYNI